MADQAANFTEYEARASYVHTSAYGASRIVGVLEWRLRKSTPTAATTISSMEAMQRVARHLGYLDTRFKPTALAQRLRPGRQDRIEILDVQVYPAPGRVLDAYDPRFQSYLFGAEPELEEAKPEEAQP